MISERRHPHFFSEKTFPDNITFLRTISDILPAIDLIILIIPNQFIKSAISEIRTYLKPGVIFLNLSKWIDNTTLRTVSDTLRDELGNFSYYYAVLSWGMIASELFLWKPLWAQIGISDKSISLPLKELFQSDTLDIKVSDTYKNIELFGALKNIFALYVWYLEWRGHGYSTIGYHFTRLWKDFEKLIVLLGGMDDLDFSQYALGGDMIATCFGNSRNRYLGTLIWSGRSLTEGLEILKIEKKHAEWYETLKGIKNYISWKGVFPELERVISLFLS